MKYSPEYSDYQGYDDNCVELPTIKSKNRSYKRKTKPVVANLIDTQYDVVEQVCWDLNFKIVAQKDLKNWDIKWTDSAVTVDLLSKLQSHQKINHFPGMNTLSRKNNLARNLSKMQYAFPEFYNFFPKTFILPGDMGMLRNYFNESRKRGKDKTFIVKPEASCQGRGIFLTQEIQGYAQCVVQTYIDRPLLYKGLKFDLRIYALVAGCDPLRIYIYNEGLVRFATEKYEPADEQNIDNLYVHLTNYAINKDNPKYVFNQSLDNLSQGHKKSLAEFFQTLKGCGHPAHQYWSSIKQTIVKTLISGQPHLQHEYRMGQQHNLSNNMCFEILGFDFMIDDRNKLYLLQVNYTPSFSTETPLDHLIKSNLIRDTLILMNVTPQARDKAQKEAKEILDRRVYTGKMIKLSPEERHRKVVEYQEERDDYEKRHLGSFEKIYPSRNPERQAKYQTFLEYAMEEYRETSSPQRIGHARRSSSKYRIKKIISNSTICEDEQKQGSPVVKTRPYNKQSPPNPEINIQNTVLYKKLKDKIVYGVQGVDTRSNIYFNPVSEEKQRKEQPGKEMIAEILKTKNGQSTMFSRQYNRDMEG